MSEQDQLVTSELEMALNITPVKRNEFEQELMRSIAIEKAEIELTKQKRKDQLLKMAIESLKKGNPVTITDEMRELGIDKQITGMSLTADLAWKINRLLVDSDD